MGLYNYIYVYLYASRYIILSQLTFDINTCMVLTGLYHIFLFHSTHLGNFFFWPTMARFAPKSLIMNKIPFMSPPKNVLQVSHFDLLLVQNTLKVEP